MKKTNLTIMLIAITVIFLAAPAFADEVAVSVASREADLRTLVEDANQKLEPLIRQNDLEIELLNNPPLPVEDYSSLQGRFMNLFLNAVAYAPKSGKLQVGFDDTSRTIFVKVPKKEIQFSVEREITDVNGHKFLLKTVKGEVATYSLNI